MQILGLFLHVDDGLRALTCKQHKHNTHSLCQTLFTIYTVKFHGAHDDTANLLRTCTCSFAYYNNIHVHEQVLLLCLCVYVYVYACTCVYTCAFLLVVHGQSMPLHIPTEQLRIFTHLKKVMKLLRSSDTIKLVRPAYIVYVYIHVL